MQTRFDQAIKQILQTLLEPGGSFTPAIEVSPDPQSADGYFEPAPDKLSAVEGSLLGRMTSRRCSFEMYSTTLQEEDVETCIRKHLNLRHILSRKMTDGPLPYQWMISSGFPKQALRASGGRQLPDWPPGVYGLPTVFATSIVVVNKLPEDRSTLILRLMGRGKTLRRAVDELIALPENAFERCAALPILVRYRIDASLAPVSQNEQEYLVTTQEIIKLVTQQAVDKAVKEAVAEVELRAAQREQRERVAHERSLIKRQIQRRFGSLPEHVARCIDAADLATLDRYADKLVVVPNVDDIIGDD